MAKDNTGQRHRCWPPVHDDGATLGRNSLSRGSDLADQMLWFAGQCCSLVLGVGFTIGSSGGTMLGPTLLKPDHGNQSSVLTLELLLLPL
jgi:hypothetical protein